MVRAFTHSAMGRQIDPSWGGGVVHCSRERNVAQR